MRDNLLHRVDQYLNEGRMMLVEAGEDAFYNRISAYHLILESSIHVRADQFYSTKRYGNRARADKVAQEIKEGRYAQYLDNPGTPEGQIAAEFFSHVRNSNTGKDKQIRDMCDAAAKVFKFVTPEELKLLKVFMNLRLTKITRNEQLFTISNAFEFIMKGNIDRVTEIDDSFINYLNSNVEEFRRFRISDKAKLITCAKEMEDEIVSHSTFDHLNEVSLRKILDNTSPCYIAVSVLESIFLNSDGTARDTGKSIKSGTHLSSGYTVYKVHSSHETSRVIGGKKYVDWCLTDDQRVFDHFVGWGDGYFLIFLKDGYNTIKPPNPKQPIENYPLDDYSLSMVAAGISKYGKVLSVTGRWNYGMGGYPPIQAPGQLMSKEALEELVGISLCNVK